MIPHRNRLRLTIQQITQKSTTWIVLYKRQYVLGTMTFVEDSPLGVPMDKIFQKELDKFRLKEKRFAEATLLAINDSFLHSPQLGFKKADQMSIIISLFQKVYKFGLVDLNLDYCIACFHAALP